MPNLLYSQVDIAARVAFSFQLKLRGIGVSIVDTTPAELMYCTVRDLGFTYRDSNLHQTYGLVVKWLQIDNQLYEAPSPLILWPTVTVNRGPESKTGAAATEIRPTIQVAMVRSKDTSHGVDYYKYFTLLLQEMSVDFDEAFLLKLLEFFKFNVAGKQYDEGYVGEIDLPA